MVLRGIFVISKDTRLRFSRSVLLFCKTISAVNRNFLSLMVFKAQGVFECFAFWDTVCISVKLYQKPNVLFQVEISGVIRFFLGFVDGLVVFEK